MKIDLATLVMFGKRRLRDKLHDEILHAVDAAKQEIRRKSLNPEEAADLAGDYLWRVLDKML